MTSHWVTLTPQTTPLGHDTPWTLVLHMDIYKKPPYDENTPWPRIFWETFPDDGEVVVVVLPDVVPFTVKAEIPELGMTTGNMLVPHFKKEPVTLRFTHVPFDLLYETEESDGEENSTSTGTVD